MAQANFWNLPEESRNKVIEELKSIKQRIEPTIELSKRLEDVEILYNLAKEEDDAATFDEVVSELTSCQQAVKSLTLTAAFSHEDDRRNAFISIQAGAGGTDACDWAEMLLRMYLRYADRKKFKITILHQQSEEEGGIKNATLHIQGEWPYGYLKSERGVHRLIRISPFDSSGRRHTSFAAVDIVPEFDTSIAIDISEKDLRIDRYRSSGAGGQHVNVTDSAVRITHLPTGIVVCCQNERSQHKNLAMAMKVLQARLYQQKKQEQEVALAKQYGNKAQVSFSNQIRSYFLHPYTLIKDHRSNYETGNAQAVLDGMLDGFIEAYLLSE